MSRNYQQGVGALLSRLYDCPDQYDRKLRKERIEIEDAYITLQGACVPKQIARYTEVADLESGFFPRMGIVWPERAKERKPRRAPTTEETEMQQALGGWLSILHQAVNQLYYANEEQELLITPTDEAFEYYNEWCAEFECFIQETEKGRDFSAFFGRMSDMVLKMAALIELGSQDMGETLSNISGVSGVSTLVDERMFSSNSSKDLMELKPLTDELTISLDSVKVATYYAVKLFLPNSRKLVKYVQAYQNEDTIERVYELAVKHAEEDGRISHSKLLRNANMKAKDFRDIVKTLQQADKIAIHEDDNGKVVYEPLDPEEAVDIPDIAAPSNVQIELPAALDVSEEEVKEELDNDDQEFLEDDWDPVEVESEFDNNGWSFDDLKQVEQDVVKFVEEMGGAKPSEFDHVTKPDNPYTVAERLADRDVLEQAGDGQYKVAG